MEAKKWGFKISSATKLARHWIFLDYWNEERKNYSSDRWRSKNKQFSTTRRFGYTAKSPRCIIAYKFRQSRQLPD